MNVLHGIFTPQGWRRVETKLTIEASRTRLRGGKIIFRDCQATKLPKSVRPPHKVDAHLEPDLPAVARRDLNFENDAAPVSYGSLTNHTQVVGALSRQQIEHIHAGKLGRAIPGKTLSRLIDRTKIAGDIQGKDKVDIRNFSAAIEGLSHW